MSSQVAPIRDNRYVAYGLSKDEAAGNLTALLRFYGHYHGCRYEDVCKRTDPNGPKVRRYYAFNAQKKLYLVWSKSNNVWRCYVPL